MRLTDRPGITSARPILNGAGLYVSSTKEGRIPSDVHLVTVASPRLTTAGRQADTAPFRGGARIRRGDDTLVQTSAYSRRTADPAAPGAPAPRG